MTFKNHGCCGHIFPALDAMATLRATHGFGADDIAHIQVGGYGPTKAVCDRPAAQTAQDCRFSVQYCMGALLVLGGVRLAAFAPERLADPAIRALMPRVSVSLDPALAQAYPRQRAANLAVMLNDGTVLRHHQPTRKGDPDMPLTDDELSAKFRELAAPVLGEAATTARLDALWNSDALPA